MPINENSNNISWPFLELAPGQSYQYNHQFRAIETHSMRHILAVTVSMIELRDTTANPPAPPNFVDIDFFLTSRHGARALTLRSEAERIRLPRKLATAAPLEVWMFTLVNMSGLPKTYSLCLRTIERLRD